MAEAYGLPIQAPTVHTLVHSLPDGVLLVAQSDGQVVGTSGAIGLGRTGWVGGVAVAPAFRGRGLGGRPTSAALDWLGPRETVLLLASAAGRPIYDRLGFVAECRYRVFMAGAGGGPGGVVAAGRGGGGAPAPRGGGGGRPGGLGGGAAGGPGGGGAGVSPP